MSISLYAVDGKRPSLAMAAALGGALLMLTLWLATCHIGFSYTDESHLWYGAQRVLAGEVPLLDFHSYDPGRYYLVAAFMWAFHSHGILAMRIAEGAVAASVVGAANWLTFKSLPWRTSWAVLPVTFSYMMWAGHNHHKIFDVACSVVLVAALAWLLRRPTNLRFFVNGIAIGLTAIVGRNHGLYGVFAGGVAVAVICLVEDRARLLSGFAMWSAGIATGYSPMILAAICVPGFWHSLLLSVKVYFTMGETSNALPILWPWKVQFSGPAPEVARQFITGCLFIFQPLFGITVSAYLVWRSVAKNIAIPPLLFATALLAVPYTHHALARASLGHLAQAIFPFLLAATVLILATPPRVAVPTTVSITLLSIFLTIPAQPAWQRWQARNWVPAQVGDAELYMPGAVARRVAVLQQIIAKYAPNGEEFIATPDLPGAYALVDRRAAVWDPYVFFNFGPEGQQLELRRIEEEKPAFALIQNNALDGDPALTYRMTNPEVYDYISRNFVLVHDPLIPAFWGWNLYVRATAVGR